MNKDGDTPLDEKNLEQGPSEHTDQSSETDESFSDAEEYLEGSIEVEALSTSKQAGMVSRKRLSSERTDELEAKKIKLLYSKEKVKGRLDSFVRSFIDTFSRELAASHVRAKGKHVTIEEILRELTEGVTGTSIGYIAASVIATGVPSVERLTRNIVSHFIRVGKIKNRRITKAFENVSKGGLSPILLETAVKIFHSFESQFMRLTDAGGDKVAMQKLAEDAVCRALHYIADNHEMISSDFIAKGIILGRSSGMLKRGSRLREHDGKALTTAELYQNTGVVVSEGTINRYYSSNKGKYGYRLPLVFEKENGMQHLLTSLGRRRLQEDERTQEIKYAYILQSGDIEQEAHNILGEIEKTEPLTKGDIEAITGILPEGSRKPQTPRDIKYIFKELVDNFIGREEELEKLDELLNPSSEDNYIAVVQGVADLSIKSQPSSSRKASNTQGSLSGLGGIGKTQLALKYAEEYAEYYNNNVIWINAETTGEILSSVRNLLSLGKLDAFRRKYGINSVSEIDLNITKGNIEVIVQELYDYFKSTKSLFIFDNVKDYNEIKSYLPSKFIDYKPHVLITSRYQNWDNTQIKVMLLDVFTDQEADKFIRKALGIENDDHAKDSDIKNLADELQRLPLALAQGAAYIKIMGIDGFDIPKYLEKYKIEARKLLNSDHFQRFFHDPYAKTVFTTWKVTLDRIAGDESAGKKAIELLNIMAYLCPDSISYDVLGVNDEKLNEAVSLLKSYSMINAGAKKNVLNIHRLVQKVTRVQLEEDGQQFEKIVRKVNELTKDYPFNKEIKLHYFYFLLHVSYHPKLPKKLHLLTNRERILYLPFYSDHSICTLVDLFDAAYKIDTKEEYLKFLGEALSIYVHIPSLPLLEGTIKYVKNLKQKRAISQEDILVILEHTHQSFNAMRKRRGFKPKTSLKGSNEYKTWKLFLEFKDAYTQEPIPCLLQERRRRRSPDGCLFSWEDVDEFNEEKEEIRDFSKIKINSAKFIDYIKSVPEDKLIQFIQLANKVEVTGKSKDLVSKLIDNQKIIDHLAKVASVSSMVVHGLLTKNVIADFLNGDYKDVAINLGFIAGDQGFARVAQAASMGGSNFLAAGKLFLGKSLSAASPFLAHGTSAFFAYNLIQSIKDYRSGNKDALNGIISNGIFVGIDAAQAGIEAGELLEMIEGVSEFTGPIGEALTTLVFLNVELYHAKKRVEEIEKHIRLTSVEELSEGLRAFFGLDPSEEIQEQIEVKEYHNLLVKNAVEFLKGHSDIYRYLFPSSQKIRVPVNSEDISSFSKSQREKACRYMFSTDPYLTNKLNNRFTVKCKNIFLPMENSVVDLRQKRHHTQIGEERYLCENAVSVEDNVNRTNAYTLFNLGEGNDTAIGVQDSPNIFIVNDGYKTYIGGNKDDIFVLQGNRIIGHFDGGEGINTLDLSGFALSAIKLYAHFDVSHAESPYSFFYVLYNGHSNNVYLSDRIASEIRAISNIIGRKDEADFISIKECGIKFLDGNGGYDHLLIVEERKCDYDMMVAVRAGTTVNNEANGNFTYHIQREVGEASVKLKPIGIQSNHKFRFDYVRSELSKIHVDKHQIRFDFVLHDRDVFVLTISYSINNAQYLLSDYTEIYITDKYIYAEQSTNKTVEEIINTYSEAENQLNMTMLFRSLNHATADETILIGYGAHEAMYNNPLSSRSHLIGSGSENVYVITSAEGANPFPIPEVVIHNLNVGNGTDTLDLRKIVQQAKRECTELGVSPKINSKGNDLMIRLYADHYFSSGSCINLFSKYVISSVILKNTLLNKWYERLHIALRSTPMYIRFNDGLWNLEPLPLAFNKDKKIIVITSDDVEKNTVLIIHKEAGDYIFARSRDDLIVTNSFDQDLEESESCTISFRDFYQNAKMRTISIKFADHEIALKAYQAQIDAAEGIETIKKEYKNQVYRAVLNHTMDRLGNTTMYSAVEEIRIHNTNDTLHPRDRRSIDTHNVLPLTQEPSYSSSAVRFSLPINRAYNWVKRSIVAAVAELFTATKQESDRTMEQQPVFAAFQLDAHAHGDKQYKHTMTLPEVNNVAMDRFLTIAAYATSLWFKDKKWVKNSHVYAAKWKQAQTLVELDDQIKNTEKRFQSAMGKGQQVWETRGQSHIDDINALEDIRYLFTQEEQSAEMGVYYGEPAYNRVANQLTHTMAAMSDQSGHFSKTSSSISDEPSYLTVLKRF